ncbi:MAG: hypothetical protein ACYC7F_05120 [Gemmatimonadaceae bacterium]
MATFIKEAERLMHEAPPGLTVEAFRDLFDRVLVRLDQLQIKSAIDVDNLEAVCGLLEMAELVERFPQSTVEEARSLSRTLRIVLAETVQYTCLFVGDNRPVQPDANYSGLVTLPRPVRGPSSSALDRAFISFNYDLALDFALTFHHHPVFYGLGGPRDNAAVSLLKLHGSLNWARCTGCGAITVVPMAQLLGTTGVFRAIRGRLNVIRAEIAFETLNSCSCGATGRREVGLAPPSVNKGLYYQSFKPAWLLAARELSEAEEIFIIGYSLPTSDLFFRDLFALALAGPARVKKIEVVNTYGGVADAVKNMLGPKLKPLVQYSPETFENWIRRVRPPQQ